MPRPIRVAVVGAGNMGRNHVRVYSEMDHCKLVALADIDPASADLAKQFKAKHYTDYRKMLEVECPDAVSVVVPTPYHLEVGLAALAAGSHVLMEKPVAADEDEAETLRLAAVRSNRVLTVGHVERFNPAVRYLHSLISSGRLGEISAVSARRVGGFPRREPKTNVIVDLAIHDIDIMSYLLGRRARLIGAHGSRTFHGSAVDSAELFLDFGGAGGVIQTNWVTPVKIRQIAVTGSKGYVEVNYLTQSVTLYEHTAVRGENTFEQFVERLGTPRIQTEQLQVQEPLREELEAFTGAIISGNTDGVMSCEDAIDALRLALEASNKVTEVPRHHDPSLVRS